MLVTAYRVAAHSFVFGSTPGTPVANSINNCVWVREDGDSTAMHNKLGTELEYLGPSWLGLMKNTAQLSLLTPCCGKEIHCKPVVSEQFHEHGQIVAAFSTLRRHDIVRRALLFLQPKANKMHCFFRLAFLPFSHSRNQASG